jgi:hypothetical protein
MVLAKTGSVGMGVALHHWSNFHIQSIVNDLYIFKNCSEECKLCMIMKFVHCKQELSKSSLSLN